MADKHKIIDGVSLKSVAMPLEGVHCASCASKIESALAKMNGVSKISVHLPTKTVFIDYNLKLVSSDEISKKIEETGYKVLAVSTPSVLNDNIAAENIEKEKEIFFYKFVVSVLISLFILSDFIAGYSPYTLLLATTFAWLWCGSHFHKGLLKAFRAKTADMNTLVSLSSSAAYFHSFALMFFLPGGASPHFQWHEITILITFINLGRWIATRSKRTAGSAGSRLRKLAPKFARIISGGKEELIAVELIKKGDIMLLRPGEQVPVDGEIIKGFSSIDESFLTGESLPKEKGPLAKIYAGTINMNGGLEFKATDTGEEMALMKIVKLVRISQSSKSSVQRAVDKISAYFVPAVLLIAIAAFVFWFRDSGLSMAANVFAAVLASACPCAMGLAVPMATSVGFGRAAENGILINNSDVFERVSKVNTVIFDKTGTITKGKIKIVQIVPREIKAKEFIKLLVSAQYKSEHPFAEAARVLAIEKNIKPEESFSLEALPGKGISAIVGGRKIVCGSRRLFEEKDISVPGEVKSDINETKGSVVLMSVNGVFKGYAVLADTIREESVSIVRDLKGMGILPVMASGDRLDVVKDVSQKIEIDDYYAGILPEDKKQIVFKYQAFGKKVIMVGDGFNDAAALSEADIGIAFASGSDIAIESSDITLMRDDLSIVADAIKISRAIHKTIKQNLIWAFIYNILLIPLAAGILYKPLGIILPVHFAGAAMAMSSVSVVMNSLRLRKVKI